MVHGGVVTWWWRYLVACYGAGIGGNTNITGYELEEECVTHKNIIIIASEVNVLITNLNLSQAFGRSTPAR